MKTTLKTTEGINVEINVEPKTANTAIISFPNDDIHFQNSERELISNNSFLFRNGKGKCIKIKDKGIIDLNANDGTAIVSLGWEKFEIKFI